MPRLDERETNAYDTLGVAPGCSASEIKSAFHRLIDNGHYRVGLPARYHEQRARQIGEAYATLGDPVSRRAYDDSLAGPSGRALWPAGASDAAEEPLVQPAAGAAPQRIPITKAHLSEFLLPTENPQPETTSEPPSPATENVSEIRQPEEEPIESNDEESVSAVHEEYPLREEDWTSAEVRRVPKKSLGIAAAVATIALIALALFLWWPRPSPISRTAPESQLADRARMGAQDNDQPVQVAAEGAISSPEKAKEDGSPARENATQIVDRPAGESATETPVPSAIPTPETQTQSSASEAASDAPGLSTSSPPSQAPAGTPATPATGPATGSLGTAAPGPVAPGVAPAVGPPRIVSSPTSGVVRVPAQWIGGGPVDSDNRHRRFKGTVIVQFTVLADGRATGCVTAKGSGDEELDAATCRLVEQRARFKPALDAQNRPVASQAHAIYQWGHWRRPKP